MLAHKKEKHSITQLSQHDLHDVIGLQNIALDDIAIRKTPPYIVYRPEQYFLDHLEDPHCIVGIRQDQSLIAQAIHRITHYTPHEIGLPDLMIGPALISVLQGAIVHPDARGSGLMKTMVHNWVEWASARRIEHLFARTEASHIASQKSFLTHGFDEIGLIKDARDGADVKVFYRSMSHGT